MNIKFCCVGILWRLLSISLRVEFSGLQLSQDPQMIGLVRSRKIHLRFVGDSLEIHQRCIGDSWRHDKPTARGNSLLSAKELRHLKTWPRKRPGLLLESLVLEILEALLRFSGLFSLVFSSFFLWLTTVSEVKLWHQTESMIMNLEGGSRHGSDSLRFFVMLLLVVICTVPG